MYSFIFKYYKYLIIILLLSFLINIVKNFLNIYLILFLIFTLIFLINKKNQKLLKKILYKYLFKNKKNASIRSKFSAAKLSLDEITQINNKIKNIVNTELLTYEKNKLEKQLKIGDYSVLLFGAGSSGKTSLARALLKSIVGKISPTIGTTKEITSYKIRIPILKRNINIIDTPGLFEPSKEGEEREKTTLIEASSSDLILFVIDQDINKYELYLIKKLSEIGKKLIIVLNKCDLRSDMQNKILKNNIVSIISRITNEPLVVETIANPISSQNTIKNSYIKPDVNNLFRKIIDILDDSGEELLADNILLRCNKLGLVSKKLISKQRELSATKVINKYSWITAGVILVNPLPVVDFIATTSANVQMIFEIAKIFEIKITKKDATNLSKSLITTISNLGILKGGITLITTSLSINFTTAFVSKSIQSITSGWLMRIVGLSLVEYFKNDQNWGENGIQDVVNKIYELNRREEILNNFINEALNKINIKKNYQSSKKLPPDFRY